VLKALHNKLSSRNRLNKIDSVQTCLQNVIINNEFLWILMQLDLDRLKDRVDNTNELHHQSQECIKRMRQMKVIEKHDSQKLFNKHAIEMLQNALADMLPGDQLKSIEKCLQAFIVIEDELRKMLASVIDRSFNSKKLDAITLKM